MTAATTTRATPNDVPRQTPAAMRRRIVAATPTEPAPLPKATRQMDVTPALAAGWLLRNTRNRPVRLGAVAAMVRDMRQGRWLFAGGTIGFDRDGTLVDGQHRLISLVESQTTQRFIVVPDLDPEVMSVVDTGTKRSTGDVLALSDPDLPNPGLVAAICRIGVAYERGRLASNDGNVTNGEMIDWLNRNRNVINYARLVNNANTRFRPAPPAVVAWCWWRLSSLDAFDANAFFEDWKELKTAGSGDPLNALLKRLATARDSRERLLRAAMVAMIFRAWNGRRKGETLRIMKIASNNGLIEIPEPK